MEHIARYAVALRVSGDDIIKLLWQPLLTENAAAEISVKVRDRQNYDKEGNITIPYTYKGYKCNNQPKEFTRPNIQAISFFSGCGGLDIGTQLAGVKVLTSLDFYDDAVETLKINPFFNQTIHMNKDINQVTGKDYSEILKKIIRKN